MKTRLFAFGLISAIVACSGGTDPSMPAGPIQASPPSPPPAPPPPPPPPPAQATAVPETMLDEPYGEGATETGSIPLLLDVYQSGEPCTVPRPVVILIHGGGFRGGDKATGPWPGIGADLTERGYVAISINYRLEGDAPVPSDEFEPVRDALFEAFPPPLPEGADLRANAITSAFEDATTALRWSVENAEALCIDTDRIGLWGGSAGAVISMHLAYALDDVGINVPDVGVVIDYWGQFIGDGFIQPLDASLLILHGDQDGTVAYDFALAIEAEALATGLSHSFYTVAGAGHSFASIPIDTVTVDGLSIREVTYRFLEAHFEDGFPTFETRIIPLSGG